MRQKKLYTIIAFETTYQAIKSEKTLKVLKEGLFRFRLRSMRDAGWRTVVRQL